MRTREEVSPRPLRALCPAVLALAVGALLFSPGTSWAATNVRIQVDGRILTLPETGETVREALAAAAVTVNADDQVSPALDAPAPQDGLIRISRVTFQEGSLERKIPYRTVVRPASRISNPYHPTITQEGRSGLKRISYRVKLVDGKEQTRTTVSEEVVRKPVDEIVTSRRPAQLASRGAYTGARTLNVLATAYDPGPGSCGKFANGSTCNGKRAGYGIVAVDPKVIPLGSKLHIPGYGYAIAADVGGAIKGNRVDLGFNSRSGSFKWGKRWVRVMIVE